MERMSGAHAMRLPIGYALPWHDLYLCIDLVLILIKLTYTTIILKVCYCGQQLIGRHTLKTKYNTFFVRHTTLFINFITPSFNLRCLCLFEMIVLLKLEGFCRFRIFSMRLNNIFRVLIILTLKLPEGLHTQASSGPILLLSIVS